MNHIHYQFTNGYKEVDYDYEPSLEELANAIKEYYELDLAIDQVMDNYLQGDYDQDLRNDYDLMGYLKDYFENQAYEEFVNN